LTSGMGGTEAARSALKSESVCLRRKKVRRTFSWGPGAARSLAGLGGAQVFHKSAPMEAWP